ncbi:MAG: 50S ribosomal protein L2 [Candidatus Nanoarchaeia archaeon]|nr:50S ribosomal protein L2 [Candidatus Nanoarchaeia archaeon]
MGKRLIQQRRGRGTFTYKAHSHRSKGKIDNQPLINTNETQMIGKITDLIHCAQHSGPLAEIQYSNKQTALIAAPKDIKVGQEIVFGEKAPVATGNTLALKDIPEGTPICNIESCPGHISFCRASGSAARIVAKFPDKIVIELPSKKQKKLSPECKATIGTVAGSGRTEKPFVKAGKKHHLMRAKGKLYPRTSGIKMNAVDHPFGSGRGKNIGKPKNAPRFAPAGRNVGLIRARRTGRKR